MKIGKFLQTIITIMILLCIIVIIIYLSKSAWYPEDPIKIGVLFSETGELASSERPLIEGTILAVKEINAEGGILNRNLEIVLADGKSSDDVFEKEAIRLIKKEKVSVLLACLTSSCRKRIKEVVEHENHLLLYPVAYEGLEQSPNIIYLGAAPNQQIIPAIKWASDHLGNRFYLVGSDYIWPHIANEIIKAEVTNLGGVIVGEDYLPLGETDMTKVVKHIKAAKPQVILHTLIGTSNVPFFAALHQAGITPQKIPVLTFAIGENQVQDLKLKYVAGNYVAWGYFETVADSENVRFVKQFKENFGENRVTTDPMISAYTGVKLWAEAVQDARTDNVLAVRDMMLRQSIHSPAGPVYIDPVNRHVWRMVRIGQFLDDGQIKVLWESAKPIPPDPYPPFKSKSEWHRLLQQLYERWGKQWGNYQKTNQP
ncbi:MAG TPA: urea ABC transporter substrate-binding protein [Gammaproteobacteria bacterium]|nr:urea ABC transporter substrate-binding protein [Gammaproteobacteria bacterium]